MADLRSVWDRGFRDIELLKRATLAGTGACQGAACMPHLRAFVASKGGSDVPFTARPAARPLSVEQAAADQHFAPVRRTALHHEHLMLGAKMERMGGWWRPWSYGDTEAEYRAVREGVSICDVSTLGKAIVSGPDAVAFLEEVYPNRVGDMQVGRSRYVIMLDEAGYVHDDGLIVRDDDSRFTLTFTTGGASFAESWLRDWADALGHDVRILDRTAAVGAINVTGPKATELLERLVDGPLPRFMGATSLSVGEIGCRVLRLSFTGEVSYELHHTASHSVDLWRVLLEAGSDLGVNAHGLDVLLGLRLEKGHIIVGMDSDFDSSPRRLGMEWAVKMDKPSFVGRQALLRTNAFPLDRRLCGLVIDAPTAPPDGSVITTNGAFLGHLTSSRHSIGLARCIALGWIRLVDGAVPEPLEVGGHPARVVSLPFYDPDGGRMRA